MKKSKAKYGYSLVELTVAMSLFVVVMVSSIALMERDANLSRSTLSITAVEDQSTQMLYRIERELAESLIDSPRAILTTPLNPGDTAQILVGGTLGFPEFGQLLLSRGLPEEEIVAYAGLDASGSAFNGLTRGGGCTPDGAHAINMEILWIGFAEPIVDQVAPPATSFDGRANEEGVTVFYRGRGAGISYRIPVDPTGGTNVLNGEDILWGAVVGGVSRITGWAAIEFVPSQTVSEADTGDDINQDGDAVDVFDIGQLRRRVWDTAVPGGIVDDLGLGPTAILQERCNWGSDLDADGFEDPIFFWDPNSRQLHIRLFVIGRGVSDLPIVRFVESVLFLRNENAL